ncbi:hypothetical protein BS78_03G150400 [Paspalum vaginatum]|nr:hypothetical protein BS78_03G150400 [Paspalum vaginatum]
MLHAPSVPSGSAVITMVLPNDRPTALYTFPWALRLRRLRRDLFYREKHDHSTSTTFYALGWSILGVRLEAMMPTTTKNNLRHHSTRCTIDVFIECSSLAGSESGYNPFDTSPCPCSTTSSTKKCMT